MPGRLLPWSLAALLGLALVGLGTASVSVRVKTEQGEVIVETDDPDIQLTTTHGGGVIRIQDKKTGEVCSVDTRNYRFGPGEQQNGLMIDLDSRGPHTLSRDGKTVVTIRRESGVPVRNEAPREIILPKTSHVIGSPDILIITAEGLVPPQDYCLEPIDELQIQVTIPTIGEPVIIPYTVTHSGVPLLYCVDENLCNTELSLRQSYEAWLVSKANFDAGLMASTEFAHVRGQYEQCRGDHLAALGRVFNNLRVAGMTLREAQAAITTHLAKHFSNPRVGVTLVNCRSASEIRGHHLVRPDGTISFATYGSVHVAGLTARQAQEVIRKHLRQHVAPEQLHVAVDISQYNSKVYYVITDHAGFGETVQRHPITGGETLLDVLGNHQNPWPSSVEYEIWISRSGQAGSASKLLRVDWRAITQKGVMQTNYQILPGDRIYIRHKQLPPPPPAPVPPMPS
jgi:protein involved in polysaccharide export with SLBB domain